MPQADGLAVNPLTSEISPDGRWGVVMCRSANALTIIDLDRVEITGTVALEEDSAPLVAVPSCPPVIGCSCRCPVVTPLP